MDEYYKDYGIKHITYLRLTREISGNMSENWCRQAAYKFANDAGINLLYDNNKTAIYNCYGYSRELSDHIDADANKINVEMAFWYDEIKNVTNFTIGYPVVNGEF